jgi:hypothetical protein
VTKRKKEMEREKKERKDEGGVHVSFGRREEIRFLSHPTMDRHVAYARFSY